MQVSLMNDTARNPIYTYTYIYIYIYISYRTQYMCLNNPEGSSLHNSIQKDALQTPILIMALSYLDSQWENLKLSALCIWSLPESLNGVGVIGFRVWGFGLSFGARLLKKTNYIRHWAEGFRCRNRRRFRESLAWDDPTRAGAARPSEILNNPRLIKLYDPFNT